MTTLHALVEPETAGDPMTRHTWVRRSLRHRSGELTAELYKMRGK